MKVGCAPTRTRTGGCCLSCASCCCCRIFLSASRALLAENRALPYTHLGLGRGTVSNRVDWIRELVACRHLPALRSLALRGAWGTPPDLAKLWTSTLGAGLTHFSVTSTALAPWFERLATLELASFAIEPAGPGAGWSLEGTRVGDRLVVEARYHERSKSSQPLPELWAHLEAMTPARIGRLVIAQARSLGSAVAFRKQVAKRFPHVELVL